MENMKIPTIDPKNPYALSPEEEEVLDRLIFVFENCEKLQRHIPPFSAKIRWLLLRDAFWRKKRPMKKRKTPIIVFWKTIRL